MSAINTPKDFFADAVDLVEGYLLAQGYQDSRFDNLGHDEAAEFGIVWVSRDDRADGVTISVDDYCEVTYGVCDHLSQDRGLECPSYVNAVGMATMPMEMPDYY